MVVRGVVIVVMMIHADTLLLLLRDQMAGDAADHIVAAPLHRARSRLHSVSIPKPFACHPPDSLQVLLLHSGGVDALGVDRAEEPATGSNAADDDTLAASDEDRPTLHACERPEPGQTGEMLEAEAEL